MTELRAGLVAAGVSVPDNNQQIIGALNVLYDNSPTFKFGLSHVSGPVSISFGRALNDAGQEVYGISRSGQIEVHSSFSQNWVAGSTSRNLGGPGALLRWEVDATTSTWVPVAASLIEILAHEIFHNTTYAGAIVPLPQFSISSAIGSVIDNLSGIERPLQIGGGHYRYDADTVTAAVNQISFELWTQNQSSHFTFKPFNGADQFALRQDPLFRDSPPPQVQAGDPFRWDDPLLRQLQLRSDIAWMNLPQVIQAPYDPEGYFELMRMRLTGLNVVEIGFEPRPNAPGFDEAPTPATHNSVFNGAFAWLRDDVLMVLVNGVANVFQGTADTLGSLLSHMREFLLDDLGQAFQEIPFAQFGSIFGSNLSKLVHTNDPWGDLAVGTTLGTIGLNIGQGIDNALDDSELTTFRSAFDDLPAELSSAGLGAIGSYLFAEWVNDQGLGDAGAGAVNAGAGAAIGQIADNLLHLGQSIDPAVWVKWQGENLVPIFDPVTNAPVPTSAPKPPDAAVKEWNTGLSNPNIYLNAAGAFLGTYLASKLVKFDTIGGQIGASLGSAIGAAIGISMLEKGAGWLLQIAFPGIGAFIGYILGGLIGSLFGGTPKAGASLAWNENAQRFAVANVWAKSMGPKDAMRSMASQVGELLNGVIAASGSRVTDVGGVQAGAYEIKGKKYWYKPDASGAVTFTTKDVGQLVNHGAFIALSDLSERLVGGDVYIKRAVAATVAQSGGNRFAAGYAAGEFETNTLFGNISTAQSYGQYLQDAAVINALMAAEPNTPFTAGWTITFARVIELGLDRRWKSDWLGGWAAFLDETADGKIDGGAFAPGNVFLELDPETNERLFVFTDADGALLGVLGDTIDTESKDNVLGTANADAISVNNDSWIEAVTQTHTTTDPETGLPITVTETINVARNGWRITNAAGFSWWNPKATGGPAYQVIASGPAQQIRVAALIDGDEGDDVIRGGDLGNDLLGGLGADTLVGGKLDDWLLGGADNDRLFAGAASNITFTLGDAAAENAALGLDGGNGDYLEGGLGDDALYGARGSDWLNGGDGIDRILGGAGGDILQGGKGDEKGTLGEARILGGAGSDQYVFGFTDGKDVIFDESDPAGAVGGADPFASRMAGIMSGAIAKNWAGNGQYLENGDVKGGEDAISFGPGITLRNIVMKRSGTPGAPGADLIIQLANDVNGVLALTGDEITIKDWFNITRRVEWLRFADGEEVRIGDMTSFIVGTTGPDVIIGTYGADFMVGDDGDDQMRGLAGNDYGFGGGGNDFVAGDSDNDLVAGGSGADSVIGGAGNDTVFGDDGADALYGGAGNDILAGGLGADQVITGAGNDIIRFERGDGRDTVLDEHVNNWDVVWQNGLYLNGYTLQTNGTVKLGTLVVFDGQKWIGLYDWDDTAKILRRHKGAVSGNVSSNAGSDSIEFGLGVDIQDVILRRVGNDLDLAIGNGEGDARLFADIGDHILIKDWFTVGASIEQFVFTETGAAGGYTMSGGTDGADTLTLTAVANWATGSLGDDTIVGSTSTDLLVGGLDQDTLRGGAGNDILLGGGGNDLLEGGAGGDQLVGGGGQDMVSYASSSAAVIVNLASGSSPTGDGSGDVYSGIEGAEGSAFADRLTGNASDNTLRGLAGADTLIGGAGWDTYEFDIGAGADIIRDGVISTEQVLDAAGALSAGYTTTWTLIGTVTHVASGTGYVSYEHRYRLVVKNSALVEVYRSRDNVDFIYFNQPNTTTLVPLPSGAAWPYANGQWLLGFERTGNGVQTARDLIVAGDGGVDAIAFGANVSLSDLVFAWTNANADLVITYAAGDSITIQAQNNAERAAETLLFKDGLEISLANLRLGVQAAGATEDVMFGDAGANTIDGGDGNDVISGGAGADTLKGGTGDDILEGGAGADVFDGGFDSITLGASLIKGEEYGDTIRYVRSPAGVIVDLTAKTITGRNATTGAGDANLGDAGGDSIATNNGSNIENVVGSEGFADALYGDVRANRLFGLGGDDILIGYGGDDVLMGGAGNDTLSGFAGVDTIDGGDGNDTINGGDDNDATLNGGAGNDIVAGDAGHDHINGGDGNDTLSGNNDDDVLSGDAGDDSLNGGAGVDQLVGGLGNDNIFGGDGNDELVGSEGADVLTGGNDNDTYSLDAASGADTILDPYGVNTIVITGIPSSALWFVHVGSALVITAIGYPGFSATINSFFATTSPSLIKELQTDDASLFLNHPSTAALINAMTAYSASTPAAMPASITSTLSTYWDAGNVAAPRVQAQSYSTTKGVSKAGSVGAVDHDQDPAVLTYAPVGATLDANTGIWTLTSGATLLFGANGTWNYTPVSTFEGNDSFTIRVTDAAGNAAEQIASVFVLDPNVNYAPDAPTIASQPLLNVQEGAVGGLVVATLAAADPNQTIPTLRIASDPTNLLEIVGNQLRFKAGTTISYAALQNLSVQIEAVDAETSSGLVSVSKLVVNIGVLETNHAPSLPAQSFNVAESTPGAGQVVVATLAPTDPDGSAVNRNFRYQVLEGDTSVFSVDEQTGEVRVQGLLDYETRQTYGLKVQIWDGGALGVGLSSPAPTTTNVNFTITNVNEAPSLAIVSNTTGSGGLVGRVGGVDPEAAVVTYYAQSATAYYQAAEEIWMDYAINPRFIYRNWGGESQTVTVSGFVNATTGNVYYVNKNLSPIDPSHNYIDPASIYYLVSVRSQDPTGIQSQPMTLRIQAGAVMVAPVVLDLDGDGLELISVGASSINFDMAGNGELERTGWVGADDGLLVYDRNGNGTIDGGNEIAFSEDVDFAASDLEGLRGYDSNEDGLFNVGDAQFANFAVWRDLNQDGVSQAGELSTLAQLGIDAISLTLQTTGESVAGAHDNVIYGTTSFLRADGSFGTVGDVYLAYIDWSMSVEAAIGGAGGSGQLAPIVFDLDGDGVQLSPSTGSGIVFDANNDGHVQATGWFSAGDGVLALDRNGDGIINSGLEISFREDVDGAQSDLEGLAAYDSNENGMIDAGDAAYSSFTIWRDANQDGFSQSHEMGSLARYGIASINLTRSNVASGSTDPSVNSILAEGAFIWRDGGIGQLADVTLGFQADGAHAPAEGGDRTADDQGTEHPSLEGGGGGGGLNPVPRNDNDNEGEDLDARSGRRQNRDREQRGRPRQERDEVRLPAFANSAANDDQPEPAHAAMGARASALHAGLGVSDRKLLGMIDAMARFEASSSADLGLGRRKLDPRVAELLTSLPDIR